MITITTDNWDGTAEHIAEIRQFARDYNWDDTVGPIDAEHAAETILPQLGEDIHPDARARLRAAIVDSAERENEARSREIADRRDPRDAQ